MKLFCYTRTAIKELYDIRLANSLHIALYKDGKYINLNHNSGVLYGKASENEDGSLNPKCLKAPVLIAADNNGVYKVACLSCDGDGKADPEAEGKALLFSTKDFLEFSKPEFIPMENYEEYKKAAVIPSDCTEIGGIKVLTSETPNGYYDYDGIILGNIIDISDATAERLQKKLISPVNTEVRIQENQVVASEKDVAAIKATAVYSDGTSDQKKVRWDTSNIDFSTPGTYEIFGKIQQPHFDFPVAINRADPCVAKIGDKYYFIATNDADGNHSLYIRQADTIEGLKDADEVLLLDSKTYDGIGGLLWAPEFHEIKGKLYIFHACTPGEFFWEESHVMELKKGGNPMNRNDWFRPKRVVRADGTDICEAGKEITLDMTTFEWQDEIYAVWSQRQFLPKDLGAWLYIGKLNPDEPWKLACEPVVLSKPEYGWANNHTFVDEGPYALIRGDTLYLTFSSAAVDVSYVVGLLQIQKGKDPMNPANWKKNGYPILTARCVTNEWGTGHNAYVIDDDGNVWNTYHARPGVEAPRCSGIRRVHFNIDGEPVLDLTEEKDLLPEFKIVKTKVVVK